MTRRLSDLYGAWPLDSTLRNLAGLLDRALETSSRLRLFASEAAHDGLHECVEAYERIDRVQREHIVEVERQLRIQLAAALAEAQRRRVSGAECTEPASAHQGGTNDGAVSHMGSGG
jgi:hypothetical protein